MKAIETSIALIALFLCVNYSNAQNSDFQNSYIKVYVKDGRTTQAATEIDLFMRAQSGVITSRMDKQTGIYLCIFEHDVLTVGQLNNWITNLGYTPSCFVTAIYGNGEKVLLLDKSECSTGDLIQK